MPAILPSHRWQIAPTDLDTAMALARSVEIIPDNPTSLLIAQVLINRGISSAAQVEHSVHGRGQDLQSPAINFRDLNTSKAMANVGISKFIDQFVIFRVSSNPEPRNTAFHLNTHRTII
jgi:hypothetical protein